MSTTFGLYDTITKFQRQQQEAYVEYMEGMKAIEETKGSQYYTNRQKILMEKRRQAEDEARKEAKYWLPKYLEQMQASNNTRTMPAPTEEQLRILQAMKMRSDITEAELDQIANAMNGNALGLGIVHEFAREIYEKRKANGAGLMTDNTHPKNYAAMATGLPSIERMKDEIKHIGRVCSEIINGNGANRTRAMFADMNHQHYGSSNDHDMLPREKIADSERAFYSDISSIPFEDLQKCVNNIPEQK